jgi:predicted nucleotidyltransferase
MKPSQALAAHRAELRKLVTRHALSGARVFGSVLNGQDTDDSDLDLLVEPSEKTGLMSLAAFKIEAEKLLGVEVSVVTPNALPAKFRSEVMQKAQAL